MEEKEIASSKLFPNRRFVFHSIAILIIILILITSAISIGNYLPKLENWFFKILKTPTFSKDQKLQFISFELFGLSFIVLLLLARWIIHARREAIYHAERTGISNYTRGLQLSNLRSASRWRPASGSDRNTCRCCAKTGARPL